MGLVNIEGYLQKTFSNTRLIEKWAKLNSNKHSLVNNLSTIYVDVDLDVDFKEKFSTKLSLKQILSTKLS